MSKGEYNVGFDAVKAILALFIVGIHTILSISGSAYLVSLLVGPIFRIAVPIFFLFSGYFFFKKQSNLKKMDQENALWNSIRRYGKLYLFWLLVLSPVTVIYRGYFHEGLIGGLSEFINQLVFESTFPASWYISSLMWSVVITFFASRIFSNKVLLWCALSINVVCTLATNYGLTPLGDAIANTFKSLPVVINPSESFLIALVWIVLGKMFAEGEIALPKKASTRIALLLITLIGLYLEQYLNLKLKTTLVSDSFFMLIPLCTVLFGLILDVNVSFKERALFLRAFSTITYCMHISLVLVLKGFLKIANIGYQNYPMAIFLWIFVVVTCSLVTLMIVKLENRSSFKWLKFAH